MPTLTITGQLESASAPQTLSNGTIKRTFVVYVNNERNPAYSDHIECEVMGDKAQLIDQFAPGAPIEVTADLRGREWKAQDGTVKHFLSLNAWRIGTPGAQQQPPQFHQQMPPQYAQQAPAQYAGAKPEWGPQSVNYPPTQAMMGKTPQMGQQPPLFNNDGTPADAPF